MNKLYRSLVLLGLLIAEIGFSCPVCGVGQEESRGAFLFTTGLMTAVPLLTIGSLIYWLRCKIRRADQNQALSDS